MTIKEYLHQLKQYSQYDFSEYSDNSIQRRLQKIMDEQDLAMNELLEKTKSSPVFVEKLVNEITVNTTEFFRDPEMWIEYTTSFLDKVKRKKTINIWHAGSSSGQEVYSNLCLLGHYGYLDKCNIIASDLNQSVVDEGANGIYRLSNNIKSIEDFKKAIYNLIKDEHTLKMLDFKNFLYGDENRDELKIKDSLRKIPVFTRHDLVKEPLPFEIKFDVIFCRNVLIYFNTDLQSKILKMFHDKLNTGGILILGSHEGVSGFVKTRFVKKGSFFAKNNIFHFNY